MKIFMTKYNKKDFELDNPNFIEAIDDYLSRFNSEIDNIKDYEKYKNYILVGTGGNAIYLEPLKKFFTKNTIILDAPYPETIEEIKKLSKEDTLIIYMSRSGNTLEVISSYYFLKEYPALIIASKGIMKEIAEKNNIKRINVRTDVSGRFMLATNVVGIPCHLAGLDYKKILTTIKENEEDLIEKGIDFGQFLFHNYSINKDKIWIGSYTKSFESLAYLLNQLINEGAGKDNKGPISFLRSVPRGQHELLQRIMGGKNDITSVILTKATEKNNIKIEETDDIKWLKNLKDLTPENIINSEAQGTIEALKEKDRALINIEMPNESLESFAKLFFIFQICAYTFCKLENVDPFSNPDVDLGKEKAREIIINLKN